MHRFAAIGIIESVLFPAGVHGLWKMTYAGKWKRAEGHPDTMVIIHPSAASPERKAGSFISTPGGWYDAGDYNKYIVNSGNHDGNPFSAYEDFKPYFNSPA